MASSWDKIPSIPNIEVDWDYEPESSLGNRMWKRLIQKDLHRLFGVKHTSVKMIAGQSEMRGRLVDISQKGLGIMFDGAMERGGKGKIGFHLGEETIVSQVVTKNSVPVAGNHRVGMEFVGLPQNIEDYIVQLVSADSYGQG